MGNSRKFTEDLPAILPQPSPLIHTRLSPKIILTSELRQFVAAQLFGLLKKLKTETPIQKTR